MSWWSVLKLAYDIGEQGRKDYQEDERELRQEFNKLYEELDKFITPRIITKQREQPKESVWSIGIHSNDSELFKDLSAFDIKYEEKLGESIIPKFEEKLKVNFGVTKVKLEKRRRAWRVFFTNPNTYRRIDEENVSEQPVDWLESDEDDEDTRLIRPDW